MPRTWSSFPVLSGAVGLAHRYWKEVVREGDTIIDATCGNGHDTAVLAQLLFSGVERPTESPTALHGRVIACDIQEAAIKSAQARLLATFPSWYDKIEWWNGCHSQWPEQWPASSVRLIVYNLGYLPGAPPEMKMKYTTHERTTWPSVQRALQLLAPGGLISIAVYPGHPGGESEALYLLERARELNPAEWGVCYHQFLNRSHPPSLILLEKAVHT